MNIRNVKLLVFFFCASMLIALPAVSQTTWYVDDDAVNDPGPGNTDISDPLEDGSAAHPFDAIQEGIDAAADGDTVEVKDGTFAGTGNYLLDFSGKAILLESENGAEQCDINGDGPAPGGVVFTNGEGPDSVLRGFLIHHVAGADFVVSSPIRIEGASPTIENNIIRDNRNENDDQIAGAIYCVDSDAVLQGNLIENNDVLHGIGIIYCSNSNPAILSNTIRDNLSHDSAAIVCDASSPEIIDNVISDNSSDYGYGAGILCESSSSPIISGNTITGNTIVEEGYGGGICCRSGSSPQIIENVISGNNRNYVDPQSGSNGGGICCIDASPVIAGNYITDNAVYSRSNKSRFLSLIDCHGAGIACYGSASPAIVNNYIAGNQLIFWEGRSGYGGGIYCGPGTVPVISNNTIIDNYASDDLAAHGSGIYCESSSAIVVNCIVRGNLPEEIDGCDGLVSYSNVEGGYPGSGNIDADPLFVAGPDGCCYLSHTVTGQTADSPCVDAGSAPASEICFSGAAGTVCMDQLTTRIDEANDAATVDMGYHHGGGLTIPCPPSLGADFTCAPAAGTVPFSSTMSVSLRNLHGGQTRRMAAHIDLTTGDGHAYPNWRSGFADIDPGQTRSWSWAQMIPALGSVLGDNVWALSAEDVTAAPFNQPPYPPSGDSDTGACTVTGLAR